METKTQKELITPSRNGPRSKAATTKPRSKANLSKSKPYFGSLYPGLHKPLPPKFASQILRIESLIGMPVWVIIQNEDKGHPWGEIGSTLYKGFQSSLAQFPQDKPAALLIDSPGGDAHSAYRLARMLQRRTGNKLTVIVPQYAKSAATLLTLGALNLILGRDAELGPLDVQMWDVDRETMGSALDAVQSLERLNAFALKALDQTMWLLVKRTGKRTDVLLPHVLTYIANFLCPLIEKIDTVDYTKKSRELKVAEEYAVRLMKINYSWAEARRIAQTLVERYPTHGFAINKDEIETLTPVSQTESFGLGLRICKTVPNKEEVQSIMDDMIPFLDLLTVAGRITEVSP